MYGRGHEKLPIAVNDDVNAKLISMIKHWIKIMLTSANANRCQFLYIIQAIERVPQLEFVSDMKKMLERDLSDRAEAREQFSKTGGNRSSIPQEMTQCNAQQYRNSFSPSMA